MRSLIFTFLFSLFIGVSYVMATPEFVVVDGPDTVCANTEVHYSVSLQLPTNPGTASDFAWQLPEGWTLLSEIRTDSSATVSVFVGENSGLVQVSLVRNQAELPISDALQVEVKLPADIVPVVKQVCGPGLVEFEVEGPDDNGYKWFGAPGGREFVNRGGLEKYDEKTYSMYIEEPSTIYVQHTTPFGCTTGLIPVSAEFLVPAMTPENISVVSGFPSLVSLSQSNLYSGAEFFWYASEASSFAPFHTGTDLQLEGITGDTVFYVAVSVDGCISERTPVNIIVEEENFTVLSVSSEASVQASAYPNPFFSSTTVSLPGAGDYSVQVLDASGRILKEFVAEENFDLGEELNQGFYMVKLSNQGNSDLIRILKQ